MSGEESEERTRLEIAAGRFKKKTAWVVETDTGYGAVGMLTGRIVIASKSIGTAQLAPPKLRNQLLMTVFEDKADAVKAAGDFSKWMKKEGLTAWSGKTAMKKGEFWVKVEKVVILSRK
ncbi:MAG: hypothetical protein Q7T16_02340 [Candidatus Burarchaeum sp.]|nr:hypothetical protein [Candidatus Burarchaeum sp.]MDO8339473.1 hypothetical protein [Candidatus Burarchaeum sp.]